MSDIIFLANEHDELLKERVRAVLKSTSKRLYIYFSGYAQQTPTTQILTTIASLYDITAIEKPCLDVVPLLPFAGWNTEAVGGLEGVKEVVFPTDLDSAGKACVTKLQSLAASRTSPPSFRELTEPDSGRQGHRKELAVGAQQGKDGGPSSEVEAEGVGEDGALGFAKVAVGGTFDRLHAGHRSLLAASALVATCSLYIGVTADQLLVNKKYRELLQSYDVRCAAAVKFVESIRPGLEVVTGPLLDPKARTAAASEPDMEALVVSQETRAGGDAINQDRRSQGFKPLALVVVNLVGSDSKALDGEKLSSTALREKEAADAGGGVQ